MKTKSILLRSMAYVLIIMISLGAAAISSRPFWRHSIAGDDLGNLIWGAPMLLGVATYAYGLSAIVALITGKTIGQLNKYWEEIDSRPVWKCFISIVVFTGGAFAMAVPVVLGNFLAGL